MDRTTLTMLIDAYEKETSVDPNGKATERVVLRFHPKIAPVQAAVFALARNKPDLVERATVGASFERMYVPSFSFGGSTQSQEIRGFVRMPLDKNRFYVQGSAAWRRNDPFIANELQLDTIWIRSTLGYSATRWFRIEGFHAFTRQDSIVTGGEINRHRLGVQAVVSQSMRIQ